MRSCNFDLKKLRLLVLAIEVLQYKAVNTRTICNIAFTQKNSKTLSKIKSLERKYSRSYASQLSEYQNRIRKSFSIQKIYNIYIYYI